MASGTHGRTQFRSCGLGVVRENRRTQRGAESGRRRTESEDTEVEVGQTFWLKRLMQKGESMAMIPGAYQEV